MEAKDLDEKIIEVWQTLSVAQKESAIELIQTFKDDPFLLNEEEVNSYNKGIEEAEQRIAKGQFTSHDEAKKKLGRWR